MKSVIQAHTSTQVYADIRKGSLERRRQTTAGSRIRTCCCRVHFGVRIKLAGSLDVGVGRDRRRFR